MSPKTTRATLKMCKGQGVGVDLIWITDGKGYREMQRSLKDAYTILPNIYNLQQAKAHLLADLEAVL